MKKHAPLAESETTFLEASSFQLKKLQEMLHQMHIQIYPHRLLDLLCVFSVFKGLKSQTMFA